jgi:hypothetical protein
MRSSKPRAQGPAARHDSMVLGQRNAHPLGHDTSTTGQTTCTP